MIVPDPRPVVPDPRPVAIVEGDAALRGALGFALRAEGYAVAAYASGAEIVAAHPDACCLIAELELPDTDGLTLIEQLRAVGFSAPAILLTTLPDATARHRAAVGGIVMVEKPLLGQTLSGLVAAALTPALV